MDKTKKGTNMAKGMCSICGTKKTTFVSKDKAGKATFGANEKGSKAASGKGIFDLLAPFL